MGFAPGPILHRIGEAVGTIGVGIGLVDHVIRAGFHDSPACGSLIAQSQQHHVVGIVDATKCDGNAYHAAWSDSGLDIARFGWFLAVGITLVHGKGYGCGHGFAVVVADGVDGRIFSGAVRRLVSDGKFRCVHHALKGRRGVQSAFQRHSGILVIAYMAQHIHGAGAAAPHGDGEILGAYQCRA